MIQTFAFPEIPSLLIHVLRLDANHALISGNKYYKLKPWLEKALSLNAGLMSCGGAYSNHLHALAAAGQQQGIATYGLVRAMQENNLTTTLQDCQPMGMQLFPVSRADYRKRYEAGFADKYLRRIEQTALWVPEGGTDESAVAACEEIGLALNHYLQHYHFDSVWLAVGSGGTLAGIARSLHPEVPLYAVPVLKHWKDVRQRVNSYLGAQQAGRINWVERGDFGGFGRYNRQHVEFIARLEQLSGIPFEPVYTAKLVRRLHELYQSRACSGNRPLVVHTGGLQGRRSIAAQLDQVICAKAD